MSAAPSPGAGAARRSIVESLGLPVHPSKPPEDRGRPGAAPAPLGEAPAPAASRVAVIVAHGMGQQVPFETLEGVARAIQHGEAAGQGPAPIEPASVTIRAVPYEDRWLHRAEVFVTAQAKEPRRVDLYECYWAPLTEGHVSAGDTVGFLLGAGWQGMRHSFSRFDRLIFGRWHRFRVDPTVWLRFLGVFVVILALLGLHALLIWAVGSFGWGSGWGESETVLNLTWDLMGLIVVVGAPLVSLGIAGRHRGKRGGPYRRLDPPSWLVAAVCWTLMYVGLAALVVMVASMGVHVLEPGIRASAPGLTRGLTRWTVEAREWSDAVRRVPQLAGLLPITRADGGLPAATEIWFWLIALWGGAVLLTRTIRTFLVQYVGDVAAYVSSYKVSKFADLRTKIRDRCCEVARHVYTQVPGEYQHVVVVGHSLGSLIAYDMLNDLVIESEVARRAGLAKKKPLPDVAETTRLLLTLGSPLDKTAFIFRNQRPERNVVREAMAASAQPLIGSYAYRPREWINIHSGHDWISGIVDYYDPALPLRDPAREVKNVIDREAFTPLAAHTEYWENSMFARILAEAVRA